MRKMFYLIGFILFCTCSFAQDQPAINNTNYYKSFKDGGSINWLRSSDVVPIIIDELLKNGIPYHTIGVGELLKINDSTRLVVTVDFRLDKDYGFLYEASHGLPLNPKDREFMTGAKAQNFVQAETSTTGSTKFMRIDPLPNNIFLLSQRCYWFQYDNKGTLYPVSKDIARDILRQDIKEYIRKIQSLKQ